MRWLLYRVWHLADLRRYGRGFLNLTNVPRYTTLTQTPSISGLEQTFILGNPVDQVADFFAVPYKCVILGFADAKLLGRPGSHRL